MQRTTTTQRARLLPGSRRGIVRGSALPAALLTASALLMGAAPAASAQNGGWGHYEVAEPKVITLEFETDLLAWDLCWSEHTAMTRERIANAAVARMTNPGQLHVIDIPGLPPFYRRTSSARIWRDLEGDVITSRSVLPNRRDYHLDVERALIDVAARIREARPGARLAFKNFEIQPLPGRPDAYTELGAVQDFYITDRTIYLNRVAHILDRALASTFYRARVEFAEREDNWLVFPNETGQFSLASINTPDWPPAEFEPEIMALWGGDGDDDGAAMNGSVPVLVPGNGWSGPTVQPDPIGSPATLGADAKAISRWNVVPYQDVETPFQIGVVAFHINGIDRVEFSVDGGSWVSVHTADLNPRTETEEYSVILDPSQFSEDGKIEVRAIVYPSGAGIPRVLAGPVQYAGDTSGWYGPELDADGEPTNPLWIGEHSLELFVNSSDSLPVQTIELDAGEYTWGHPPLAHPMFAEGEGMGLTQHDEDRWVVIKTKPGVSPDQIRIVDAVTSRPYTNDDGQWTINYTKVKLDGLTIQVADPDDPTSTDGRPTYMLSGLLWLDNCHIEGPGQHKSTGGFTISHGFFTNTRFSDLRMATGYHTSRGSGHFVRSCAFERIGEKAIRAAYLVLNTTITDIYAGDTAWHSSAISNPMPHDNRIYQNLDFQDINAKAFAFRSESSNLNGHRDVVLSGVRVSGDPGGSYLMYLGGAVDNMLVRDTEFDAPALDRTWAYRITLPPSDPRYFRPHTLVYDSVTWNSNPASVPAPFPMSGVYFLD